MENKKRMYTKLFQYFMMLVIFAAVVFLPPYAAKWQAAMAVGEDSMGGEALLNEAPAGSNAQADGLNGVTESAQTEAAQTIVIDPGHGGGQLRFALCAHDPG